MQEQERAFITNYVAVSKAPVRLNPYPPEDRRAGNAWLFLPDHKLQIPRLRCQLPADYARRLLVNLSCRQTFIYSCLSIRCISGSPGLNKLTPEGDSVSLPNGRRLSSKAAEFVAGASVRDCVPAP